MIKRIEEKKEDKRRKQRGKWREEKKKKKVKQREEKKAEVQQTLPDALNSSTVTNINVKLLAKDTLYYIQ